MLVLTRKRTQSIVIGDNIRITVLSSTLGRVSLGIEAPKHVPVNREEIVQDRERQKFATA